MKTFVITGASDGVGAAAVRLIHRTRPNDRIVVVGRNPEKTARVADDIGSPHLVADFESLREVRELAEKLAEFGPLAGLANNAGGIFDGPLTTADGFERTWQVNVVAPFLLTSLLREQLGSAPVVQTASIANVLLAKFDPEDPNTFHGFSSERAYGNAKLGTILLTHYLHEQGLNSVAFHPGVLATNFSRTSNARLSKAYTGRLGRRFGSAEDGARNLAFYLTGTAGIHFTPGEYYNNHQRPGRQKKVSDAEISALFNALGQRLHLD
ncbi:SDR family NAD(P)-dependent oxidoreductase [Corynebacterium confusum]